MEKKSTIIRIFIVCLIALLVFPITIPVLAATYRSNSWTDGTFTYYLEAYTNGTYSDYNVPIPGASVHHYYGHYTPLYGYYDLRVQENWSNDPYYNELIQALSATPYKSTYAIYDVCFYDAIGGIRPEDQTGIYNIEVRVDYTKIGYSVYQQYEYEWDRNLWDSGEVRSPQYIYTDNITGYSLAS